MERFRKSIGELDLNYNMERGVTHIIETIKFTEILAIYSKNG